MHKLLLEFSNIEDARIVKKDFEKELHYEILASMNPRETQKILSNKSVQLIIYQPKEFRQQAIDRIDQLRQSGYNYPILVILDHLTPLADRFANPDSKITFIEKPFELRTLRGLTKKLITTRAVTKQQFRRYRTDQTVGIETFVSGENVETKMFNLSKGGAYFELAQKPSLGVGELLRLKFQLDQVDKDYRIHGRIVWTTPKGYATGGYGIGVKFIKSEDIYRHLLQQV